MSAPPGKIPMCMTRSPPLRLKRLPLQWSRIQSLEASCHCGSQLNDSRSKSSLAKTIWERCQLILCVSQSWIHLNGEIIGAASMSSLAKKKWKSLSQGWTSARWQAIVSARRALRGRTEEWRKAKHPLHQLCESFNSHKYIIVHQARLAHERLSQQGSLLKP